jgi:hypothetical protein
LLSTKSNQISGAVSANQGIEGSWSTERVTILCLIRRSEEAAGDVIKAAIVSGILLPHHGRRSYGPCEIEGYGMPLWWLRSDRLTIISLITGGQHAMGGKIQT